ncbi:MAG: hypothetical protein SVY10_03200 [Thermodesulfobacteriota bacterium]|nr:hypothetical protein [Thermodesulfobacteriota bacterium]
MNDYRTVKCLIPPPPSCYGLPATALGNSGLSTFGEDDPLGTSDNDVIIGRGLKPPFALTFT